MNDYERETASVEKILALQELTNPYDDLDIYFDEKLGNEKDGLNE